MFYRSRIITVWLVWLAGAVSTPALADPSAVVRAATALLASPAYDLADTLGSRAQSPLIEQDELLSYLAGKDNFTLIDARSAGEFAAAHVAGAINIPAAASAVPDTPLPGDLDRPLLVYCSTGQRAARLTEKLLAQGYRNVRVLPAQQLLFQDALVVFNCGA